MVTNYHVIEGATEVKVHLGDRDYPAEVKGTDPATDLALLKIDAGNNLRYLELGDSDAVRVGDWVMVIGNPLNLDKTVTTGVVSAKGRSIGISDASFENFIQTDAAINFGNSGGPLVNLQGEVVGIATAINWGAENIGFAVPVNTLKEVLPQLREKGKVSRGYLGIQISNLNYDQAQAFGLESTDGALVALGRGGHAGRQGRASATATSSSRSTAVKVKTTRDLINYVVGQGSGRLGRPGGLRDGKTHAARGQAGRAAGARRGGRARSGPRRTARAASTGWASSTRTSRQSLRQMHGVPDDVDGVVVTAASRRPARSTSRRCGRAAIITEVNGQEVDERRASSRRSSRAPKSGSYLRLYVMHFARGGQRGQPFFAVVQVP